MIILILINGGTLVLSYFSFDDSLQDINNSDIFNQIKISWKILKFVSDMIMLALFLLLFFYLVQTKKKALAQKDLTLPCNSIWIIIYCIFVVLINFSYFTTSFVVNSLLDESPINLLRRYILRPFTDYINGMSFLYLVYCLAREHSPHALRHKSNNTEQTSDDMNTNDLKRLLQQSTKEGHTLLKHIDTRGSLNQDNQKQVSY